MTHFVVYPSPGGWTFTCRRCLYTQEFIMEQSARLFDSIHDCSRSLRKDSRQMSMFAPNQMPVGGDSL